MSEGWRALWPIIRPMTLSVIAAGATSVGIVAWNDHVGPSTTPLSLRIAGVFIGLVLNGFTTLYVLAHIDRSGTAAWPSRASVIRAEGAPASEGYGCLQ